MTVGNFGNISRRKEEINVDENFPLLSNNHEDEEMGFDNFGGASFHGSMFNLSCNIVGSGIMCLPAILKLLGIFPGIFFIVLAAFLTEASIEMLLRLSKAGSAFSYADVMQDAFGKSGKILLQATVVISNIGALTVFMIIIEDVLSGSTSKGVHHAGVLEGWFGEQWWNGRAFVILAVTIGVFIPLIFFKRIDSLKYTSTISVMLAMFLLVVLVGVTIYKITKGSMETVAWFPNIPDWPSFWSLFSAVPIIVCIYLCHFNVHTIENELKDSPQMRLVVQTSLTLCAAVYILTGFFGVLLFGDAILPNVLSNFDADLGIPYGSLLGDLIQITYAVHIILVFPILFFPLRLNLDGLLFPSARSLGSDNVRFVLISLGLVMMPLLGAVFIPSIWNVFELSGATVGALLAFAFPAAIAFKDPHRVATKKDKILAVFMIICAAFSNAVPICSGLYSLLT